jgi:hypothetical protein
MFRLVYNVSFRLPHNHLVRCLLKMNLNTSRNMSLILPFNYLLILSYIIKAVLD